MRAPIALSALLLVSAALVPTPAGATDASTTRETHVGAQAVFDTGAVDEDGMPLPGTYLSIMANASISSWVVDGEAIPGRALFADLTFYEIDEDGNWIMVDNVVGWTDEATIFIDPNLQQASASGTVELQRCGWGENGPYCDPAGSITLALTFVGGAPIKYEPQQYTEVLPGPDGYVYTSHRTATLREATATGELGDESLGASVSGNFYRVHTGEVFVSR